jgi:hypothetical protein
VFWGLCVALLPVMVALSSDFGATWDEPQQRQKAHHLLSFWQGRAATLEVPIDGAHLYGAPVDVAAAALERHVPADPYVIRHAVIAAVGWLGVVLTGLLALRVFGLPEGLLSVALLAANPLYVAHAMNNPKDLPFATAATAWLLVLARLPATRPFITRSGAAILAGILGLALNIRAGALLFWVYLVVLVGYRALSARLPPLRAATSVGPRLLVVLAGGVALGWLAWPWAYDGPLTAPFRAMTMLSRFPWGGEVLFGGQLYSGRAVPDSYVPQWLWMTLPPAILMGAAASLLVLRTSAQPQVLALWSVAAFPVMYVIGTRATLYDGIRHLLFILPPLTVLAAAGLVHLVRLSPARGRWAALALIGLAVAEPIAFQWRNHPNQIAYVQPLAGGPRAAFGHYDLDYWGNCVLEALRQAGHGSPSHPTYVSGWPLIVLNADAPRVPAVTLVEESDARAQRFVRLVRGSRETVLALTSSSAVVGRVTTADGADLCVVLSRRAP